MVDGKPPYGDDDALEPATAREPLRPTRRRLLALAFGAAAVPLTVALAQKYSLAATGRIKAIAFDAFPIFDLRPVFAKTKALFPEQGDKFRDLWFQKLFAYTWLRTTARRYVPFDDVIAESFDYAADATGAGLGANERDQLLDAFWTLPVWPDVPDQLRQFREQGLRLAFLSNMSERMLVANMRHNGIESLFDASISTDRVRAFKPAPEAYALAAHRLGLSKHEIAFAAFAAWDAAGASWFGYPTAWVNRLGLPAETVGAPSVRMGRDLTVLADLVRGS